MADQQSLPSGELQEATDSEDSFRDPDSPLINDVLNSEPLASASFRQYVDLSPTKPLVADSSLLGEETSDPVADLPTSIPDRRGPACVYPKQPASVTPETLDSQSSPNHPTIQPETLRKHQSVTSNPTERYNSASSPRRGGIRGVYAARGLPASPTRRRISQCGIMEENLPESGSSFHPSSSEPTGLSSLLRRLSTVPGNVLPSQTITSRTSPSSDSSTFSLQPQSKRRRIIQEELAAQSQQDDSNQTYGNSEQEIGSLSGKFSILCWNWWPTDD